MCVDGHPVRPHANVNGKACIWPLGGAITALSAGKICLKRAIIYPYYM
jgi:hypothetical protein